MFVTKEYIINLFLSSFFVKKNIKISENLKTLRKINNLTAEQLAKSINLKIFLLHSYENHKKIPPIITLIKIATFFGISLDYLILGLSTTYPKNLNLFFFGYKIDLFDMNERYKIEGSISALVGKKEIKQSMKFDNSDINLTNSFHQNIKILRLKKSYTQLELSRIIGIKRLQIIKYEQNAYPRIEKIVKLSEILDISIHALLTGKKLFFSFQNQGLFKGIQNADILLSLEEQQFIIKQMQRIIEDSNRKNS